MSQPTLFSMVFTLKLPIENYVLDYFVIGVIPSLQLRTASEHFFCHSDPERSEGEESDTFPSKRPKNLHRRPFGLRLRVTEKK